MAGAKIVLVGAGSYVFGPSMLSQILKENRLQDCELALVDPNREAVDCMAEAGRRLAAREGVRAIITSHESWDDALPGTNFVVCSAAVQMNRRYQMDREIIDRISPGHLATEFGGVAGISYSLRQIALIRSLCDSMRRQCPNAWLLNISNPLPRVCQAAHESGIRTVGFCSVSLVGYGLISEILEGRRDSHPFEASRSRYRVQMGGTNHLSWLLGLQDRQTGEDLMPRLRAALEERQSPSRCERYGRMTGYLLMSGDEHVQDFLPPEGDERSLELTSHGSDDDRERRADKLRNAAAGSAEFETIEEMVSWERPIDLVAAVLDGESASFTSLNLINDGEIPQLPKTAFVETRCKVDGRGVHPDRLNLPMEVLPYSLNAVEVTESIVRGAERRETVWLKKAVYLDPTIVDKQRGWEALERCLHVHEDLIGTYR